MESETGRSAQPRSTSERKKITQHEKTTDSKILKEGTQLVDPTQSRTSTRTLGRPTNAMLRSHPISIDDDHELPPHRRLSSWFADFISDQISSCGLKTTGFGRTNLERTKYLFLICDAVINAFGARLKAQALDMQQREFVDQITGNSKRIAAEIAAKDDGNPLIYTPDINRELRILHFLGYNQPAKYNESPGYVQIAQGSGYVLSQSRFPMLEDIPKLFHGHPLLLPPRAEVHRLIRHDNPAVMELKASMLTLVSYGCLDVIKSGISAALVEKHERVNYMTLSYNWDLFSFLEEQIEGEMDITTKVQLLWSVITLNGNSDRAWATKCNEYMTWTWPETAQAVKDAIEKAVFQISSGELQRSPRDISLVWSEKPPENPSREAGKYI